MTFVACMEDTCVHCLYNGCEKVQILLNVSDGNGNLECTEYQNREVSE